MKAKVYSLDGKVVKEIELPDQFNEEFREDLIKKAFLAIQSHRRQPYGPKEDAGEKVARSSKRRRKFRTTYGYGISRFPKMVIARIGSRFTWKGAVSPNAVGGRRAHPPKVEKVWSKKINKKEKRKAIRSAISAIKPIIFVDEIENLKKTKQVEELLKKIGLEDEIERAKKKKVRAGKGKMRGRKYKKKIGPLFVVSKKCDLMKASKNIAGADSVLVKDLNVELLLPGMRPRKVIWSESAIKSLEGLFK